VGDAVFLVAAVAAVASIGCLVVPFVTIWRLNELQRQVTALGARLEALEAAHAHEATAAETPMSAAPIPAAPSPPLERESDDPSRPAEPPPPDRLTPEVMPEPAAARAATSAKQSHDLEAVLGEQWMLYLGLLVLLLGVAFFLKYAFEQAWITPAARCVIGVLAGVAMIPVGLRIASRGYERYGHLVAGAGIVILYLTTYAALNLFALIVPATAAGALVLITITGAALANRRQSLPLALLAVAGGYATPLLVGGSRDAQLTLFSYIALLTAVTTSVARSRRWPQLSATAYVLAVAVLVIWAGRFYSPDKHLRTEVFLTAYCAMFVGALVSVKQSEHPFLTRLLGTAPVLYYAASLIVLWDFRIELFIYLILFSGAALALCVAFARDGLRLAAWAAAALPFLARIELTGPAWTAAMLATAAAITGMHLAAQVHRLGKRFPVAATDVLLLHGNGLFACMAGYMILEDQWLAGAPWIAWGLGAAYAALAWSVRAFNLEASLHWIALALALLASGVALRFDAPWIIIAIAAEGAGVAWIGLRVGRSWFRTLGLVAIGFACIQWLALATPAPPASQAFLLNARTATGAFIVALMYALARWHRRAGSAAAALFTPLIVAAQMLTVAVLTLEASAFWEVRAVSRFDAKVASQLSISLLWAVYAAALVFVGLRRRFPPARYVGMALFAVTVAKVFSSDLSLLAGVYRIAGFLGVGAVLVLVSFLYQRVSARAGKAPADNTPVGRSSP
jgi:uncharacterized membrane protein